MTVQKFQINTIKSFPGQIIEFKKRIIFEKGLTLERGCNNYVIDIHKVEIEDGEELSLREYCPEISIELTPEWVDESYKSQLKDYLFDDEDIESTLILNILIKCPELRVVLATKKVNISEVDMSNTIIFKGIDLNNYVNKIQIESFITRVRGHSDTHSLIANKKHSIIAQNKSISIYIDEVEIIGGDYLDIGPENLGRSLFEIRCDEGPPKLLYHRDFDKFIKGGDSYDSVKMFLMFILPTFLEANLKWLFFCADFNPEEKRHLAIAEFLSKILNMKSKELLELIDIDKEEVIDKYIELSSNLHKRIQTSDINYKVLFKQFILKELGDE